MIDNRFVCQYPQGIYCGNSLCSLSHICSDLPIQKTSFFIDTKYSKKRNQVTKTYGEKKQHSMLYNFYNCLFGDKLKKRKEYNKKYYLLHREEILRNKRKDVSDKLLIVQQCKYTCDNCPYNDCIIPDIENRKEYMDLYYNIFHDKLLRQKAEYRATHRSYLANSEKIRNYRMKGYIMNECILKETSNPNESHLEGTKGILTIIKINGNDYLSFISDNKEISIRHKIALRLNDLSLPICTEAWYKDNDGFEYTFESTVNQGNPLWEMEKNINFKREQ